jgi:hypothetical protein
MELPNTFTDFLSLIGSPVFVGVIVSVLLVRWGWFMSLGNQAKFWLVGAVCIVLPFASKLLIVYLPGAAVVVIEQWWPTLVAGMGIWMSSQVWNKLFGITGTVSKAADPNKVTTKK